MRVRVGVGGVKASGRERPRTSRTLQALLAGKPDASPYPFSSSAVSPSLSFPSPPILEKNGQGALDLQFF